jgi:Predicted dienelactone hydrolase
MLNRIVISLLFLLKLSHARPVILPQPTGPYAVGTQAFELRDNTRTMLRDAAPRRWMVQAFYPSIAHHGPYPYQPDTLGGGVIAGTQVLAYAKPNARLLPQNRFPVIIFIPGLGAGRQDYTILCEELASQGYVILALDQPYVTNFVRFSDNTRIVLTLKDAWKINNDRDYRYRYYDDAMQAAIADIEFMLKHFDDLNHRFNGQLDVDKIILMGHSFGGNVAHTLGFASQHIKAVVDIDSKITERKIYGRIGVPLNRQNKPVLFIRGMMQYQEDLGDQLTKIDHADIWAPDVQHGAFSDSAYLGRLIPGPQHRSWLSMAWSWLWQTWLLKRRPHFDAVDSNLGEYNLQTWFQDYRAKIVAWLKAHG